jgi:membrane-associated protease RseP (regulator of RpoE activity)
MDFVAYDLVLLAVFVVFTSIFLIRKRKNLKREGLLFLYKTSIGMKIIDRIGTKYKKTLHVLSYVAIVLGFFLMGLMIYFFGKIVWIYIFHSEITALIKVPPIMPLLPYLPQIFKINYLPPFYFIYWILIIAIVAISHEFSHGIFAVHKKVKLKSTGFGFFPFFLPVFLAAFVELDEKEMEKKKPLSQMAVLAAGTFANVIIAILFFVILLGFFATAFTASGVVFDTYTYSVIGIASISSINNVMIENASYEKILNLVSNTELNKIGTKDANYIITKSFLESQGNNDGYILLYDDAPAIEANLSNIIVKINGVKVGSKEELGNELSKYFPGEKVTITTLEGDAFKDYQITLGKNPIDNSKSYLGIGFIDRKSSDISARMINLFSSFKDASIYYKPNFDGADIIYNFLWWLVVISFSVALVNMLPVGIFDGGRFFYLAVLGLTKSREIAKKSFTIITYIFLALVAVIMIFWGIGFFK